MPGMPFTVPPACGKMSARGKGTCSELFVEPRPYQLARFMRRILKPNPHFRGLFQGWVNNRNHLVVLPVEAQDPSVTSNDLSDFQARFLQMCCQTLLVFGIDNDGRLS
jgi:hypothetical protein